MVDFLNTWAQKIIVVIIICAIIEMILPEGKNKKYIKTVIGIYVVFTIIGPIISKINTKEGLNLEKYLENIKPNLVETSVNLDNNKYVEDIYKEKIGLDIKEKIKSLGYEVKKIEIQVETEAKETYGSIQSINLTVCKRKETQESKIKIEPVVIGKEKINEETKISEEEVEKIKSYLGEIYFIDKEKIIIRRLQC